MDTASYAVLASAPHVWATIGAFAGGLVIAGALVWAVTMGIGVMSREEDRPDPSEQPRLPDGGAVREEREMREPDEVQCDGERLMPYELHATSTRRSQDQRRHRWHPGGSGGFGSGGPGRT